MQVTDRGKAHIISYPPAFLEYAFYGSLLYAYLGQSWGIAIPAVGGAVLLLNAVACLLSVGVQNIRVYQPVALALGTGAIMIVIQLLFHIQTAQALGEGIGILTWMELLIIAQTLSLRSGFLHRFALVCLAIGIGCLPHINFRNVGGGLVRAWASGTGISNPNILGMWFGFCTVYLLFWGFQSRKFFARAVSWTAAIGCCYVVTLSVSRAPLLGIVLACIVGFRAVLKSSFVPVLLFILMLCLIYASGVFDEEIGHYASRGAEESGRGKLWPQALERIIDSPWIGVGLGDIRIPKEHGRWHNPHNPFLHIALGAGIIPVVSFLLYLVRVVSGARYMMKQQMPVGEVALLPPLVVFGLFDMMTLDTAFMMPWAVVVFGLAAGADQVDAHR